MARSVIQDFATSTTAKVAMASALAFTSVAANAQTVPFTSGCHDGPAVEAALTKDGQKPLFIGKRMDAEGNSPGNFITMNDNGYGYNFEREPGTKKLCLGASFKNVKLNYLDNSQIPEWGKAIKVNGTIDIAKAYNQQGDNVVRLAFIAQTYTKDSNGTEIAGKAMVIATQPLKKQAAVWSVSAQGVPDGSFSMKDFIVVTANFNHFMGRGFGTNVASAKPDTTILALKAPTALSP